MERDEGKRKQRPGSAAPETEEGEGLQTPPIHDAPAPERHDGNEDADDLVEVVEPTGEPAPRVPNDEGRTPDDPEADKL